VNGRGEKVNGTIAVVLCSECNKDDSAAGALITFFAVHGIVTEDTMDECCALLATWASTAQPPHVDLEQFDREYDLWRRGEL
jgi:hypothetical protein